jgi:hypothetical protein
MVYLPIHLDTDLNSPICKVIIAFIITAMVISSPVFMLANPHQVSAAPLPTVNSIPSAPSTIGQTGKDGDFSTQAALSLTRASQTNNFVASKAYYDISFRTATAGVIKSVVMDFPAGTSVGSALIVEATGIGPGTLAASAGEVLTYTVTNAVNVPANTIIRIQISNINNPPTPSASFTVSITTRDDASVPIDGPTLTSAYNLVQVGNTQIAPGAVTTTKIATGAVTTGDISTSFAFQRTLDDGQNGWDPDGVTTFFSISDSLVNNAENNVFINLATISFGGPICAVTGGAVGTFEMTCSSAPSDGTALGYTVIKAPTP